MWIGNVMLVILNLPLVGLWVKLLKIPYRMMFPAIVVFCAIGVYAVSNSVFDVFVMAFFAAFGYLAMKLGCEPAPFVLAFVLGPLMEQYLRRAMLIARGDPTVLVVEPISLGFLLAAALLLIAVMAPAVRRKREEAMQEE
jgi:TctA family transporter